MNDADNPVIDSLTTRLAALDDFVVALAFETWLFRVETLVVDEKAMITGLPADVIGIDGKTLADWASDARTAELPLDAALSATAVRTILTAAAGDPALRPELEWALDHPDDTELKAGVTVKIGALATALMLVASTGFEFRTANLKITKEPLRVESIVALTNLVKTIRGATPAVALPKPRRSR
jgi:hypothetical protein